MENKGLEQEKANKGQREERNRSNNARMFF